MSNLQDLIELAKIDGGKFFVMDESGEAKLVIMPVEEYQRLLLGKLKRQVADVEKVNKEILRAQIEENIVDEPAPIKPPLYPKPSISHELSRGGSNQYPKFSGNGQVRSPIVDLREEVIDPSFDFEGPKIELGDL